MFLREPATSVLSLINVCEERLNENSIAFEPGYESCSIEKRKTFNETVQYCVYVVAICNVLENLYPIYNNFKNVITEHWHNNKDLYKSRLESLKLKYPESKRIIQCCYGHSTVLNYEDVYSRLFCRNI